ncbi:hypothetical protein G9A89_003750 [Geosiphon pyriformis]|nr:hypothetical protein G9A89_003750 [Geosiphon pyriformis]
MFTSGLNSGCLGADVIIVMDSSLAKHVYKVSEVPANEINSLIAKAVNKSSFIVLSSNFNEDWSYKCASFKKCLDLELVNSLVGSSAAKTPTWANSRGVEKTIDYVFISPNLINVVVHCGISDVSKHFDMNYQTVSVSLELDGLLNTHLISLCKQVNRDCWKFDIKNTNKTKWFEFRNNTAANTVMFSDAFGFVVSFDNVFTKEFSRFYKLKLLVSKLVKALHLISCCDFVALLDTWDKFDSTGALMVKSLFLLGSNFDLIYSVFVKTKKLYCTAKLLESKCAKESYIKQTIARRIESFELDKGHTIRIVLKHSFHKVVLNHLVVGDELILEPNLVKFKVDKIMKRWTKKCRVVFDLSADWVCQFQPLNYVFDSAFSGVMCLISLNKMSAIVKNLLDGKTAGLSGISNELEAWVLMISKPYEWKSVLTNTYLIALIETACKILSKIFSNRIFLACSAFNVLYGDNFLVLKSTMTQSPIFAIGSVVEDALEKNRELWLVLQDMHKAYDLAGLTSFLAADAFIDDTIWVGNSQAATQHILNVASEFFRFNDISINNNKTVAILINCQIMNFHLAISKLPISITKKKESHHYLGIFLSTKSLSKPSLAKTHLDIQFFVNLVLKKAILDKQFAYLVSAVLFLIISYKTQFSFIPNSVCNKWDALICKDLKSKLGLLFDFPNNVLYHSSLYNLKTFEQIQAESKSVSIINFANSVGILGHLFSHRSYDLQILSWYSHYPLLFPACVGINSSNNFLASMVRIFSGCDLFLGNFLACAFHFQGGTSMFMVFGEPYFFKCVSSLKRYRITFIKQLRD